MSRKGHQTARELSSRTRALLKGMERDERARKRDCKLANAADVNGRQISAQAKHAEQKP
jgi:hypothetical protein